LEGGLLLVMEEWLSARGGASLLESGEEEEGA
jgi:hypothetical protein